MRSSTCSNARSIGTYLAKTSWSRALPDSRHTASWNARSCRYIVATSSASAAASIDESSARSSAIAAGSFRPASNRAARPSIAARKL